MRRSILALCAAAVIGSAGCPVAGQNITSASLVGPITAERSGEGMRISGTIQRIPAGTKIWVEIIRVIHRSGGALKRGGGPQGPQDSDVIVAADGTFHAQLRNTSFHFAKGVIKEIDNGTFPPGSYGIMITSRFNSAWQPTDVLRKAGVDLDSKGRSDVSTNPKAIPDSPDFKPDDPEFPKAGRHLEAIREVTLEPIPSDQAAIDAVRHATLDVKGWGRSSMSVGESVDLNGPLIGIKRLAWSAARGSDVHAKWIVTLDYLAGDGVDQAHHKAQWSYDPISKTVLYLDPEAKSISYVPPE